MADDNVVLTAGNSDVVLTAGNSTLGRGIRGAVEEDVEKVMIQLG